jgi:hypothetical protein
VLGAPNLQFIDASSQGQVTFPMSGSFWDATDPNHPGPKVPVPAGYNLQVTTDLYNLEGQVGNVQAGTTPAGAIAMFDSNAPTSQTVTIEFTKPQEIVIVNNNGEPVTDFDMALTYMETYLVKSGLQFRLAGLANTQQKPTFDPISGAHTLSGSVATEVLTPRSMAFTLLPKGATPGALLIWINVVGTTNNGKPNVGSDPLQFAPVISGPGTITSPICDDHTAGIVFSYDCMLNAFFKVSYTLHMEPSTSTLCQCEQPNSNYCQLHI